MSLLCLRGLDNVKINGIEAGWFEFTLNNETDSFCVACSQVCQMDTAEQLLSLAYHLLLHQPYPKYLCLNCERKVYRMEVKSFDGFLHITICEINDHPMRFCDASPMTLVFAETGDPIFTVDAEILDFARDIYHAFVDMDIAYYEANWVPFPRTSV